MTINEKYYLARAKGGHFAHIIELGRVDALCGFLPESKRTLGRKMQVRAGWSRAGVERSPVCNDCARRHKQANP